MKMVKLKKTEYYDYDKGEIILNSVEDLEEVYNCLENNENFILEGDDGGILIIADSMFSKVKNGEFILRVNKK